MDTNLNLASGDSVIFDTDFKNMDPSDNTVEHPKVKNLIEKIEAEVKMVDNQDFNQGTQEIAIESTDEDKAAEIQDEVELKMHEIVSPPVIAENEMENYIVNCRDVETIIAQNALQLRECIKKCKQDVENKQETVSPRTIGGNEIEFMKHMDQYKPEETKKQDSISTRTIAENELKLKERVEKCKQTIEMLKQELSEEKAKLEFESRQYHEDRSTSPDPSAYEQIVDTNTLGSSMAKKLGYDDKFLDYEMQLKKYQTTLTMAQIEKKKAVRKQMMAKAFELKLLEVESQCNIELLRVKQNLQFLEPLRATMKQWPSKESTDKNVYDFPSLDLGLSHGTMKSFTDLTSVDQSRDYDINDKFDYQSTSS